MTPESDAPAMVIHRRKRVWQWLSAGSVLFMLFALGRAVARSEIVWNDIPGYVTSGTLLTGLVGTITLTFSCMLLAVCLGTIVAVFRQSGNPILVGISVFYIWGFRAVPALVQLILWFNIALVFPRLSLGPFSGSTNDIMTPYVAALLGLGLCEAAYMAEIVRSGILSVPRGQVEAARSVGMSGWMTMRRVVLPQAVRVVIPPTGNQFIGMLKFTSLAFAVSYQDLLSSATRIYTANFAVIEVLLSATIWYLVLCTLAQMVQAVIERHFAAPLGAASIRRSFRLSLKLPWRSAS